MFYLQDYEELLQQLPIEIRKHSEELLDLDCQVRNLMNHVENDVEKLFLAANVINPRKLESGFQAIMKRGEKAIQISENKIQKTDQVKSILSKYIKRLDDDLNKYKEELNSNNNDGVAELIERRVIDSERCNYTCHKNNNFQSTECYVEANKHNDPGVKECNDLINDLKQSLIKKMAASTSNASLIKSNACDNKALLYNEPIASTSDAFFIGPIDSVEQDSSSKKIVLTAKSNVTPTVTSKKNRTRNKRAKINYEAKKYKKSKTHELRYCTCNEIAYDSMIACDNKTCPIEWFHFGCVGITEHPIGQWYCAQCISNMKIAEGHD